MSRLLKGCNALNVICGRDTICQFKVSDGVPFLSKMVKN